MKKRVADIIVDTLADLGVRQAFCVVGGGAMYLNNALGITKRITTMYNHHEQACAIAAVGYAKYMQNTPALVCVTTGPGGTNTLTGIMCAYQDSTPMIVISGQVRYDTTVPHCGLPLRRRGEQEFDIINSVTNTTKYAKMVLDPLSVRREVRKAYHIAMEGRRGPVWLDIPMNVQSALVDEEELMPDEPVLPLVCPDKKAVQQCIDMLKGAKRPCILAGRGIRESGTHAQFMEFLSRFRIPVVNAIGAGDAVSYEYDLCGGTAGMSTSRSGNIVIQNCDVLLVLACSLGYKQTGFAQEKFAPRAQIIMVDVDEYEAQKPGLHIAHFVHADLHRFFESMSHEHLEAEDSWKKYIKDIRQAFPPHGEKEEELPQDRVNARDFWRKIDATNHFHLFALGNSSCISSKYVYPVSKQNDRVIVNVNTGPMGSDLPVAIGAAVAAGKELLLATGDGSFMMNMQELATIAHHQLPIKIALFCNQGYALIRNTCKNYFDGYNVGCDSSDLSFPNFEEIAHAFGIKYRHCKTPDDLDGTIEWMMSQPGPCLVEIDQLLSNPGVPRLMSKYHEDGTFSASSFEDMYPFLPPDTLQKWMLWDKSPASDLS